MDKKKWFSFALGFFILAALFYFVDVKNVFIKICEINFYYFLLALGLTFISVLIKSYRWTKILERRGLDLGLEKSFKIFSASNFVFLFMPNVAGDFYRAYALKKLKDYSFIKGFSSALFEKFLNFGVIVVLGIFWLLSLFLLNSVHVGEVFVVFSLLILFIILAFFLLIRKPVFVSWLFDFIEDNFFFNFFDVFGLRKHMKKYGKLFLEEMRDLSGDKEVLLFGVLLTFLAWFIQGTRFYILSVALGLEVSFVSVLGIYFLAVGLGAISMAPSSLGSKEAIIVLLFLIFNVSSDLGFSLALLDRSVFMVMSIFYACMFYSLNKKIHFGEKN